MTWVRGKRVRNEIESEKEKEKTRQVELLSPVSHAARSKSLRSDGPCQTNHLHQSSSRVVHLPIRVQRTNDQVRQSATQLSRLKQAVRVHQPLEDGRVRQLRLARLDTLVAPSTFHQTLPVTRRADPV